MKLTLADSDDWINSAQFATLAGITKAATRKALMRGQSKKAWRGVILNVRTAKGQGGRSGEIYEVSISSLPHDLQLKFKNQATPQNIAAKPEIPVSENLNKEVQTLWNRFHAASQSAQNTARERLKAVKAVHALINNETGKSKAIDAVAQNHNTSRSTLYHWLDSTNNWNPEEWLPALLPTYTGRIKKASFSHEAWEMIKADYLRNSAPSLSACVERARIYSDKMGRGWEIPCTRSVQRRIHREIPQQVQVLQREGREALDRLYPAQERDHAYYGALQAVNADGHKFDVFVRYPDGTIQRPLMAAFQDIYSGKFLSYRLAQTENADSIRLALGDLVEDYGIPEHAFLDNGRGFAAKWLTGGAKTRYRFKVKEDEPMGVFTSLGVDLHWCTPHHGQAKPIERAFRDLCEYVAKHPAFEGAYTGNNPTAKPENYGTKAIPLALFEQVLAEEIRNHNLRQGRRSKVCQGKSFDEVFNASYAERDHQGLIKQANEHMRQLWLLTADKAYCNRTNGEFKLAENRYWSPQLIQYRGKHIVVRFDPESLHEEVYAYRLSGQYIGPCDCLHAVGFGDTAAAREHARQKKRFRRAVRDQLAAQRKMDALKGLIPATPEPGSEPLPEPIKLPIIPKPKPDEDEEFDAETAFLNGAARIVNE